MRSYILAIAISTLLAALYAFQNTSEITVHFLLFQRAFPQGVWEVVLFSIGTVLMWFFSILASIETHKKHRKELKDRDRRISELTEERTSLLNAFKYLPQAGDVAAPQTGSDEPKISGRADVVAAPAEEPGVLSIGSVGGTVAESPEGEAGLAGEAGEESREEEEKESVSI